MFYREHGPPHYHAEHGGDQATFGFDGHLIAGNIRSVRARRYIEEWTNLHRRELEANWERMKAGQTLERIEPLQ
jgi:hypothetical protein